MNKVEITSFVSILSQYFSFPNDFTPMNNNFSENTGNLQFSSIKVTAYCFTRLMDLIFKRIEKAHPNILKQGIGQVYGFGNYNSNQPSIKKELEAISGIFVNGKYLYDKSREIKSGKPIITINRPYHALVFEYLGYEDAKEFALKAIQDNQERQTQLNLLSDKKEAKPHYYISYHYGEYKEIVKAQVVVTSDWKTVQYKYIYPNTNGGYDEFLYYGSIKKRADAIHTQTRTLMDGKMVQGGENILYIGYGDPGKSKFILGVFSAFDINNRLIAGKIIHEKCNSKEEMVSKSMQQRIPGYIAQELRNKRIENDIVIPNDKLEISQKSPYYLTYERLAGQYTFSFNQDDKPISKIIITLDPDTFKISPVTTGTLINKDSINLIQNGSIFHLHLEMSGLTSFVYLDIYVKTYYFNNINSDITGVFSGIDFENRLLSGEVSIAFTSMFNE